MTAAPLQGPSAASFAPQKPLPAAEPPSVHTDTDPDNGELREAFNAFVGQTFYGQMLAAMRKTIGEPAYFFGGRAERIFQGQLDQLLAERMTQASADTFANPMFELFMLPRP